MKTVDARGKLCPVPLIMTKKALMEPDPANGFLVLIDNETSLKNVTRFLEDNGMKVQTEMKDAVFHLFVNKTQAIPEDLKAEEYCEVKPQAKSNVVVAFQRNRLGDGEEELGTILMKAFVNTLPETSVKPKTMVFLNSGIFLTLSNSTVIESLKKLEANQVEILVCGTCLDYYQQKLNLGVGKVSNMYDILERMTHASHVIYP
jgi:selenium metabolism protein YedF